MSDNSVRPLVEGAIPQDGDVLVYDSASGGWIPGTASGGGGGISPGDNDLGANDVTLKVDSPNNFGIDAKKIILTNTADPAHDTIIQVGNPAEGFADIQGADGANSGDAGVTVSVFGGNGVGAGTGGDVSMSAGYAGDGVTQGKCYLGGKTIVMQGPVDFGRALCAMTTTERDALSGVTDGLVIYNTTIPALQIRLSSSWKTFTLS